MLIGRTNFLKVAKYVAIKLIAACNGLIILMEPPLDEGE